ncbi:hypothetical protein M0813_15335 [Anaeramoeba flamelloides]|uniref:Uncharacterized protein n=1 Tax=Anaeramoeba flamelloides TaxID=1746091 RepID=A0AAV7ZG16_9EUKA|nr:hypothetical protein M0812_14726 [Anaeramoeba flamelloides]KAJ6251163.1 hypothetical protein M0813_15335 [Anaeramoeba flamelloides]|eukprot:Anaeramoba_flamelloidesa144_42.p1 GENE.a144_42~~a144_42.p1  ORF type:complete len:317 (+),score=55.23 a144_42:91-1041(+)
MTDPYNLYGKGSVQTTFYVLLAVVFFVLLTIGIYLLVKLNKSRKNRNNSSKIWTRITSFLVVSLSARFLAMCILLVPSVKSLTQATLIALADVFLLYSFVMFVVFWVLTSTVIFADSSAFTTYKKKFLSKKRLNIIYWSYVIISFILIFGLLGLDSSGSLPDSVQTTFTDFTYYFATSLLMASGIVWFLFGFRYGRLFLKITENLDINMGSQHLKKKTYSAMLGSLFMGLSQCVPFINMMTRASDKTTNSSQLSVLIIKSIFLVVAALFFFRAIYIIAFKLTRDKKKDVEMDQKTSSSRDGSASSPSSTSSSSSSD